MPATISYQKAQALLFQGGSIQVPAHPDFALQSQLTITAWVLPTSQAPATIVGHDRAAYQLFLSGGMLVLAIGGRDYASSPSVGQQWTQVAVTYDANADSDQLKFYLNGELDRSVTPTTLVGVSPNGIVIGDASDDTPFPGLIASVAIWNTPHSAWRIKQELSSPIDAGASDLVAYWQMDDGSGTTVKDRSPNGHDGTVQGAVQWEALPQPIVLNGAPAAPPIAGTFVEAVLAGGPTTTPLGQVAHAPSPPSGRNGEAQKLLHRVELYNQQRKHDAVLAANAKVAAAKQDAAAKLQQAHQDAARAINSTRYDTLYYLRDGAIWQVDAAGNQKPFGWTENRSTILGLVAGEWIDSHVKVTPPDAINLRLNVAPPDLGLTVAIRIGTGYQFTFGNGGAGNITGQSGTISAYLDWGPTGNPPPVGGQPTFMVQIAGPLPDPVPALALTVDPGGFLFWSEPLPPHRLRVIGTDGNGLRDLVPSSPTPITSIALAEISQVAYYADSTGAVFSVPYAGGQPTPIAAFPGQPGEGRSRLTFHSYNTCLYRTSELGILGAVQNNGPAMLAISSTHAPSPVDVVGDGLGAKLYWTDRELKAVRRANLDGSAVEDLYAVADPLPGLAIDDVLPTNGAALPREIYWCERREGITRDTPGITGYWPLDDGEGGTARATAGPGGAAPIGDFRRVQPRLPARLASHAFAARFEDPPYQLRLPQPVTDSFIGSSFTVELWVKPDAVVAGGDVALMAGTDLEPYRCLHLVIRDRKPYFGFFNHDTSGNTVLRAHEWVHLAFRYDRDNGEQAIFVNGELDASSTGQGPLAFAAGYPILIAQYNDGSYFRGEMAGLHATAKPLTQDEIRSHVRMAAPGELLARMRNGPVWASDDPPPVLHPPKAYLTFGGFDQVKLADDATTLQLGVGAFTVECWVRIPTAEPDGAEVSLVALGTVAPGAPGQSLSLGVRDNAPAALLGATQLLAGPSPLEPNRWYHLAWRCQGGQLSLLVNGVLAAQGTAPLTAAAAGPAYLGRDMFGMASYGSLSDLRIWSVARSDAEIQGSFRNFRQVLAMRGPIDGSRPPEALPQVSGAGAIGLVSRASLENEQRLIAYRKRQDAQAKAASDVAAAHVDYEAQLSAKQAELEKTHQESAASIDAKTQEQAQARSDNRQSLVNARNGATQQVQTAQSSAAQRLAGAQGQAQGIKDQASTQAQQIKDAAQQDYNNAQAQRARY